MSDAETLTPGQQARVDKLIELAEAEFGKDGLTEPERKVLRCAAIGQFVDFAPETPRYTARLQEAIAAERRAIKANESLPPASDRPIPDVKLSSRFVRWLLTDSSAENYISLFGVQVGAARIEGKLDLSYCIVSRQFLFDSCVFDGGFSLVQARVPDIVLPRTLLWRGDSAFIADRATVTGGVFLRNGLRAEGVVRLLGATIGGDLDCESGRFVNAGNNALFADHMRVAGGVFLRHGFHAEGEVRLLGASIGGDLDCEHGWFVNKSGYAASADRAKVAGSVFLRHGFRAEGMVRLLGATIGGSLECHGGRFINAGGTALYADLMRVTEGVFMRHGFHAEGEVRMLGATIGSDIDCERGQFVSVGGDALSLQGITVNGTLLLRNMGGVNGEIDLTRSRIGYLNDGRQWSGANAPEWPEQVRLTDCRYDAIYAGAPLDSASRLRWLDIHDKAVDAEVPDPQPYRWLAEIMKKQGHEDEARTVLRVCARRRMLPLVKRAFREGPAFPRRYLGVWAGVVAVFVALLWLADRDHVASTLTHMFVGLSIIFAALSLIRDENGDGLRDVARVVEAARVAITQSFYFLVVGHGYARWRAAGCAIAIVTIGVFVFGRNSNEIMQPAQAVALRASSEHERRPSADNEWVEKYPKFDPVIYSIDTLLPLVSFHQEDHWTPSGRGKWGKFVKNFYLPIHISAGWVIATLFVASFTRLMRQEG